jgi:hypothetical protein
VGDLSTALVEAAVLADAFEQHDPRPRQAAQEMYAHLSRDRLDALVDSLWLIVEHPSTRPQDILACWHVMRSLKAARSMLC